MKQLVGISSNIYYNDKMEPMLETIFMVHEPEWEIMNDQTIKKQKLTEIRVFNKAETIKKMFSEYLNTAIEEAEKITVNKDKKV